MSVDMRNSEGYLDLTAYEAIKKVEQEQRSGRAFRPIVYICSPYAGDIAGNVDAARRYSRFAVDKGYIPIAPHLLYPQFLDDADPDERELGIFFGNAMGVRQPNLCRSAGRNQTRQVEELPLTLLHRRLSGGLRPCTKSKKTAAS